MDQFIDTLKIINQQQYPISRNWMIPEEVKKRDEMIRIELEKISKQSPNTVPVYIIINEKDQQKIPDQWPVLPIYYTACSLQLVDRLKQKFPKYPFISLFGKDHHQQKLISQLSLNEKRKLKSKGPIGLDQGQKIVIIDQKNIDTIVGDAHQRYKDNNNLLVVILSSKPLNPPKKREVKQLIFILLALAFAGFYLLLALNGQKEIAKPNSIPVNITNSTGQL